MRRFLLILGCLLFVSLSFADDDILEYVPSGGKMPVILNQELLTVNNPDFDGKVFVKIAIDEKGKIIPGKISVVLSEIKDEKAKELALDVVKQLSFSPAVLDEKPVKCWLTIPVKFCKNTKMAQY